MENRSIFIAFLVAWALYVPTIHVASARMRIRLSVSTLSHLVPTIIALGMICIFLIGHGATVRQFVAGSERGVDLWMIWVRLWPLFLLAAFISAILHVMATFAVATTPAARRYLVVTIAGFLMAVFAFAAVYENFPDA
jgi:hypothetical protein